MTRLRARWRSTEAVAALLVAGFALLVLAWTWTSPVGAFPDERDHLLRAASLLRGEVAGERLNEPMPPAPRKECCTPGSPTARRWVIQGARVVDVPAALDPSAVDCEHVVVDPRQACDVEGRGGTELVTTMGTIEPAGYVAGGVASLAVDAEYGGVRAMRTATAAVSLTLVALGSLSFLRRHDRSVAVAAVVLALAPAVLFILASPSPNSLEVAGAFAFFAGAFAFASPGPLGRVDVGALVAGGVGLATARSLGPIWVVVIGAIVLGVCGVRTVRARVRERPRLAVGAAVLLGAAVFSTVAWEALAQPHVPFDAAFFFDQLRPATRDVPRLLRETVGVFGPLTIPMPDAVYVVFGLAVAAVVALAVARSRRRGRAVVLAVVALVPLLGVVVAAATLRQNGFGLQGRHIQPIALVVPLVAGVVLRDPGRRGRPILAAAAAVAVLVHAYAWLLHAASYPLNPDTGHRVIAVASERQMLRYLPSGWTLVAGLGVACLLAAVALSVRGEPERAGGAV